MLISGLVCACTHTHTHTLTMHTHPEKLAKGVFSSKQSELLPSDDTACEDDVGSRDSQGHPWLPGTEQSDGKTKVVCGWVGPAQPCCPLSPEFVCNKQDSPNLLQPDWLCPVPQVPGAGQGLPSSSLLAFSLPRLPCPPRRLVLAGSCWQAWSVTQKRPESSLPCRPRFRGAARLSLTGSSS